MWNCPVCKNTLINLYNNIYGCDHDCNRFQLFLIDDLIFGGKFILKDYNLTVYPNGPNALIEISVLEYKKIIHLSNLFDLEFNDFSILNEQIKILLVFG